MNIYAFIPLVATIAYIPLLVSTVSTQPWRRQHKLFLLFLVAAVVWSLTDYVSRANYLPQYSTLLIKLLMIIFAWTAIQFHCFTSSYFPADKGRWLPFAFCALGVDVVIVALGYLPMGFDIVGDVVHPSYGSTILVMVVPLLVLLARNVYILLPRLRNQENPILYNQTFSLLLSLLVLAVFTFTALLPVSRDIPILHLGNIIIAIILSYAVVGHQLVDIRFVLRRGMLWVSIGLVGIACYLGLLMAIHAILNIPLTIGTMAASTLSSILAIMLIYRLRDLFSRVMGKAFQGESYYYREKLIEFANNIHNIFSLKEQGGELLNLVMRAVGCRKAGLLFLDAVSEDFDVQLVESKDKFNSLSALKLRRDNPIVEYLRRERIPLTRESLAILPEFLGLWQQEKEIIEANEIELFMPLISRDRLIGILLLDKKKAGRYSLEDLALLEDITSRVAVSMEKEYLREQLKQREEELSIINRSSAIITSSLDIQGIYNNFITELKRVVDVDWAAIGVVEESELYFMALSSDIGSPWQVGERIPLKGTPAEWMSAHRAPTVDHDLTVESQFTTGKYYLQHGIRSVVYQPLMMSNEVIGALIVASRRPNAYNQRHLKLLEQLASQITMPIENARLYAKTERMARVDELTGLLNRRSLDEVLPAEIGRHSRYGGIFSLIIIDTDALKHFNDNYGHLAGDEVLRKIGSVMKNTIREADQAFRYGGDEFAILLPHTPNEAALRVAERVRQQVNTRVVIGENSVALSLGIASWPVDGVDANDIIAAADAALYQAKRAGGNRSQMAAGSLAPSDKAVIAPRDNPDSGALSTIFALAATVDARDHYTRTHSKKVHDYAVAIAESLGMEPLEINRLGTCALLHDIGKIGISDDILNKQDGLTEQDWEAIRSHPHLGAAIASHSQQLAPCIPGILHHHEKYNGEGYPDGLKGEAIPLESRILAIADAFAAMTSERSYSRAISFEMALEELKRASGSQFDPRLVEVFDTVVRKMMLTAEQTKPDRSSPLSLDGRGLG